MRISFLKHLVSKARILFFRVSNSSLYFTAVEEDGGDKRLEETEFDCEHMEMHRQILFSLVIAAHCLGSSDADFC